MALRVYSLPCESKEVCQGSSEHSKALSMMALRSHIMYCICMQPLISDVYAAIDVKTTAQGDAKVYSCYC
jgi:hypothetical protein